MLAPSFSALLRKTQYLDKLVGIMVRVSLRTLKVVQIGVKLLSVLVRFENLVGTLNVVSVKRGLRTRLLGEVGTANSGAHGLVEAHKWR